MKFCALLMLVLSFVGCKRLALVIEEIRQPALESYQSLSTFLLKKQIDTTELLCFSDTNALQDFYRKKIKIPDIRFFNKNKMLVEYRESPQDCNGMVSVFLEKAEIISRLPPVPGESINTYIDKVVYENTLQQFELEQGDYDLYLVVYWAKYMGNVNKHKVFEWLNLVEQAKKRGLKTRTIKVNVDYQELWGMDKKDLPRFEFN